MYYRSKKPHQAVKSKMLGDNQKAKALWAMKAAKDREEESYDPQRNQIRLGLWEVQLRNPVAALAKAVECWIGVRVSLLQQVNGDKILVHMSLLALLVLSARWKSAK